MAVDINPPGGDGEILFVLPHDARYSVRDVVKLLQAAQDIGLPLEKGSYLEHMTIAQLDSLVRDRSKCDA